MSNKQHPIQAVAAERALINKDRYQEMYNESATDAEAFWREQGERLDWIKPDTTVKNTTYAYPDVSGHRMGTAKVESALVAHEQVSEAAVVGYPHEIKGQGIYAYATLMRGAEPTDELKKELVKWVRKEIGPIASPDIIH